MLITNYIKTTNDVNGNPRRGWHIINPEGYMYRECEWWVEEGYAGCNALTRAIQKLCRDSKIDSTAMIRGGEYTVPVSQYKRLKKELKTP